jgi:hypothetical protein
MIPMRYTTLQNFLWRRSDISPLAVLNHLYEALLPRTNLLKWRLIHLCSEFGIQPLDMRALTNVAFTALSCSDSAFGAKMSQGAEVTNLKAAHKISESFRHDFCQLPAPYFA